LKKQPDPWWVTINLSGVVDRSISQEVVDHLSQLKASLQETLGEEERLKEQAHRVQKLAKVSETYP